MQADNKGKTFKNSGGADTHHASASGFKCEVRESDPVIPVWVPCDSKNILKPLPADLWPKLQIFQTYS